MVHPGLIGCLPNRELLERANKREAELLATNPNRVPPLLAPPYADTALMGQMKLRPEQAERAALLFELSEEEMLLLQEVPYRGSLPTAVPTDPLIYRFYELVQVYGTTWKELIQEEFGDGIMSAIDFDMTMERQPDQKGDRVKIGMSGKFLGYKTY